jgi:hypothetical protein
LPIAVDDGSRERRSENSKAKKKDGRPARNPSKENRSLDLEMSMASGGSARNGATRAERGLSLDDVFAQRENGGDDEEYQASGNMNDRKVTQNPLADKRKHSKNSRA